MVFDMVLFYDLDTKSTFAVTREQWNEARIRFEKQSFVLTGYQERRLFESPCFSIETETGIHRRWLFREDQDYCEEHVRGIR